MPSGLFQEERASLRRCCATSVLSSHVIQSCSLSCLAGLQNLSYGKLNRVEASGDPRSTYTETVSADDLDVQLTWSGLGDPFCFAFPPDKSATGKHHMPSLFVGCQNATIM